MIQLATKSIKSRHRFICSHGSQAVREVSRQANSTAGTFAATVATGCDTLESAGQAMHESATL